MVVALTYVGVSITVLTVLTVVYVVEDVHGKRVFIPRVRETLDQGLYIVALKLRDISRFFTHGFVRLLLHYGAHTILKRILNTLRGWEHRVEELVRHNRKIAKDIRAQKGDPHLNAIAQHKQDVALTEIQKEELKSK
jgi:hypothetical protein